MQYNSVPIVDKKTVNLEVSKLLTIKGHMFVGVCQIKMLMDFTSIRRSSCVCTFTNTACEYFFSHIILS